MDYVHAHAITISCSLLGIFLYNDNHLMGNRGLGSVACCL